MTAAHTHSDTPSVFPEQGISAVSTNCAFNQHIPPALEVDVRRWARQHSLKCLTSPLSEEDTMGCASSTQTTAQDTTRPNTKQDGSTSGKTTQPKNHNRTIFSQILLICKVFHEVKEEFQVSGHCILQIYHVKLCHNIDTMLKCMVDP